MASASTRPRLFVIGGGLAGLSAAFYGAERFLVRLFEAAPQPGGRCRSFFDRTLGCTIDNGAHLLLSGNAAVHRALRDAGAPDDALIDMPPRFFFADKTTGNRYSLDLSRRLWFLNPAARLPGLSAADHLGLLRLARAGATTTVADLFTEQPILLERLIDPFCTAVLNTAPDQASARLLWNVVRRTFLRGPEACRPLIARHSLQHALIDPLLAAIRRRGGSIETGRRLTGLSGDAATQTISAMHFGAESIVVTPEDRIVLALPLWSYASLNGMADRAPSLPTSGILNAHFRLDRAPRALAETPMLGLIGTDSQWVFWRAPVLSITISAADRFLDRPTADLKAHIWEEIAPLLDLPDPVPPARIVKERRATLLHSPATEALRQQATSGWRNLFAAGDGVLSYTLRAGWRRGRKYPTRLPCTIENAILSGRRAAHLATKLR